MTAVRLVPLTPVDARNLERANETLWYLSQLLGREDFKDLGEGLLDIGYRYRAQPEMEVSDGS